MSETVRQPAISVKEGNMEVHAPSPSTPDEAISSTEAHPEQPDILYKEGEAICTISPFVWTILPDCVDMYCYRCGLNPQPAKPKRCSGCQYAHYCSKECQAVDWKDRHKIECKIVSHKLITGPPKFLRDTTILMFAAIARIAKEKENGIANSPLFRLPVNLDKALVDMVNPMGALLQHKELFDICDPKKLFIRNYTGVGLRNFTFIFGAVMQNRQPLVGEICNSLAEGRTQTFTVGTEVIASPVQLTKSCTANTIRRMESQKHGPSVSTVRALRDIEDGEPLTMTREYRFATLESRMVAYAREHEVCSCKACTDPVFQAEQCAIKCTNSKCEEPIPFDKRANHPCPSCGANNSKRLKAAKTIVADMSKWLDVPEGTVPSPQGFTIPCKFLPDPQLVKTHVTAAVKVLHPTNLALGKALLDYTDWLLYTKEDDSELYLPFLQRVIPSIELHLSKYDQRTRQVYMDIVRAFIKRKKYEDAQPYMDTYLQRMQFYKPKADDSFLKLALLITEELRKPQPNSEKLLTYVNRFDEGRSVKSYQIKFQKS